MTAPPETRAAVVVLVSGSGTLLQALLDAAVDPAYGVQVVAVGADRDDVEGLARARRHGIPTFVVRLADHPDRAAWDTALAAAIGAHDPDLVLSAGFMKILGEPSLSRFRILNTHPALLPSFPGAHGVRDALAHGVRVTGATLFEVDPGVDTGRILAQRAVDVLDDDTEETLHERIKVVERRMLVEELPRLLGRAAPTPTPTPTQALPPTP
ncbi:phosphoribosylglycinamide formyltransferase [Ornithinimicrobium avium]|uniref:phosphoribosylglycinamide formyltransferase n=1 Tax=Ornithinimicrobium avium TaxID=2283195 RepID=UPI001D197C4D|nr:phosphoribosylglycinamide formyltransferase [Ornithinimicrobium avium]